MTGVRWDLVALAAGAALALPAGLLATRVAPSWLVRRNHSGRLVPAVLGVALVGAAAGAMLLAARLSDRPIGRVPVALVVWSAVLWLVGVIDDAAGRGGPRGIGGHVRRLLRGRPTTGILKLAVAVAAGFFLAREVAPPRASPEGEALRLAASWALITLSSNVWNALDVVPGRALKTASAVLVGAVLSVPSTGFRLLAAAAAGSSAGLLPIDLRERGMLGDGGSTPLGLVVGTALAVALPTAWVVAAAGVLLILQVLAETVTISRLIDAVPPLRWLDRLGARR